MSLLNNSFINIYSIIILMVIYFMSKKWNDRELFGNKLFLLMVKLTMILLVVDSLSRFDGDINFLYVLFNYTGNFLIFLLNPILVSLWILYANFTIYGDKKKTKELIPPLVIVNLINGLMVVLSQFFGWYYYIDSNNIYQRGPLFLFSVAITVILLMISFILIAINRKKIENRLYFPLLYFSIPPFIGIILQTFFYGISFVLSSLVISLLIVYINIQNYSMSTDFLTGLYNRKQIENYLNKKIKASLNHKRNFSGIMLDLNNFKAINDDYGHNIGDEVLETAGRILKESVRSSDIVARIGGDEFFIILNIDNIDVLKEKVDRIKMRIDEFNKTSRKPYRIEFSIGYAVYNSKLKMTTEVFQKHLDILMYKNKKEFRTE